LKHLGGQGSITLRAVAPLAGAWIETEQYDWHQKIWEAFPGRNGETRDFLTLLDEIEGGQHGFTFNTDQTRTVPRQRQSFIKKGQAGLHAASEFIGELQVTHTQLFQQAALKGVGYAKAFGFGMLCLAPTRVDWSNQMVVILMRTNPNPYLTDTRFIAVLQGDPSLLAICAQALENPVWDVWFGRKCCLPASPLAPILADSAADAVHSLLTRLGLDERSVSNLPGRKKKREKAPGSNRTSQSPSENGSSSPALSLAVKHKLEFRQLSRVFYE
jgi:hypothetical protein